MKITYFVFLVLALTFKLLHWPGANILFLLSPIFLFIDVIRCLIKEDGEKSVSLFASIGMFFSGIFISMRFLNWPGWYYLFFITLFINALFVFQFFKKKTAYNFKYIFTAFLFLFVVFNFSLKSSTFRLFYQLEDPFNPTEHVPHFELQKIAYAYYKEGDFKKSKALIERNIYHLTELVNQSDVSDAEHQIDVENLKISQNDLQAIKKRTWNELIPLIPEDRTIE
ncbi:MAG: hypothetical protein KA210_02865 [Bacteroidia bacterium]|nr:hypothetical protein [Bacteroidia bacterium]